MSEAQKSHMGWECNKILMSTSPVKVDTSQCLILGDFKPLV